MTHTTKPRLTLRGIEIAYGTDEACKELLMNLRWPDGVKCPRCQDGSKVYKTSEAFRWKCKSCNKNGYKFSVLTGSVFENTNMPLHIWFRVVFLMVSSKKGMSALQIWRMMPPVRGEKGSYKTFWYMCMRIRAAMQDGDFQKLTGVVEVDEAYIGGQAKNKHGRYRTKEKHASPADGKATVMGAISRKGNVTCRVIERMNHDAAARFVRDVVSDKVDLIATDDHNVYKFMDWGKDQPHESVKHARGEYVRGIVHTANIDSFWSNVKRGIMGAFHHVSKDYLPLYLNEFSWRYNHRNDVDIFRAVLAGC